MVVITLTDCPPKLRGDLSKWLFEINTGVYVGNLSSRVRDELWLRVCDNLKTGRATMVFNAPGEQQLNFEVHNSLWKPIDFDGIKLMQHPLPPKNDQTISDSPTFSRAGKMLEAKRAQTARDRKQNEYVVLDIETTGLSPENDRIIEVAAILIKGNVILKEFQTLVDQAVELAPQITELTGITSDMLKNDGIPIAAALEQLTEFVGNHPVVCHNVQFDFKFLMNEANCAGVKIFRSKCEDTLFLVRKQVRNIDHYSLTALYEHFGIDSNGAHRALADCKLTHKLFEKLNEI